MEDEKLVETFGMIRCYLNTLLEDMKRSIIGNMAAGVRARQATIALEKHFKEYRILSVAKAKADKAARAKRKEEQKDK